jgi:hypothetical protein
MNPVCTHLDQIREVTPSSPGCEECLQTGDSSNLSNLARTGTIATLIRWIGKMSQFAVARAGASESNYKQWQ